jgi:hypothetical protein
VPVFLQSMRNVLSIVFVLGIVLFAVSCNSGWDFTIINAPSHLFCGEEFHFRVACQGSCSFPLFWSARYGTITQDGWYRAPDFPCTEVVEVIGRGIRRLASFPVLMPGGPATPQGIAEVLPAFRVLFAPPSCVSDFRVPFRFAVRGSFLVVLNGKTLMEDRYHKEREVVLELPLEEGENVLLVVLEGREVFQSNILCDRTPPVIFLSRALWVPEGVWVFGTADEEVAIEGVKGERNAWKVLVPWEGEKRVVWRDRAGNKREEIFAAERDLSLEVVGPSRVKKGETADFRVRCTFRGIPLEEARVVCGGEEEVLSLGEGVVSVTFPEEGKISVSFALGNKTFEFPVEVYVLPVATLEFLVPLPREVVQGETLMLQGTLRDAEGNPCSGRRVWGEIRSSTFSAIAETLSDGSGRWILPLGGIAGVGRHILRVSAEDVLVEHELFSISGRPSFFWAVRPGTVLRYMAGYPVPFEVQVATAEGKPVQGAKVEWVWKTAEGVSPVPFSDLRVNERTDLSGKCVGEIAMPRKVGDYTLEARLPFWEVPPLTFSVTVLAAAPRFFEDLSVLPPSGRVGEPLNFRVRVRDTYGNPCPGKTVNVYLREGENLVKQQSVVTDTQGEASFTLIPRKPETLTVEARVQFTSYVLSWSLPVTDG